MCSIVDIVERYVLIFDVHFYPFDYCFTGPDYTSFGLWLICCLEIYVIKIRYRLIPILKQRWPQVIILIHFQIYSLDWKYWIMGEICIFHGLIDDILICIGLEDSLAPLCRYTQPISCNIESSCYVKSSHLQNWNSQQRYVIKVTILTVDR